MYGLQITLFNPGACAVVPDYNPTIQETEAGES